MKLLEGSTTISQNAVRRSYTGAASDEGLATPPPHVDADGWRKVINEPLIDWARNPDQLEDEGILPPSKDVIQLALNFAMYWRDKGSPAPDYVIPDGDGGIVFKRTAGDVTETIEIGAEGTVEIIGFRGHKIIKRKRLL